MTEDEMVGWHDRLDAHGFGWTLEVGDGQGGLVCCSLWVCKESDTAEQAWMQTVHLGCVIFYIVYLLSFFFFIYFLIVGG